MPYATEMKQKAASTKRKNQSGWVRRGKCRRCGICCKGDKLSPGPFADDKYVQEFIRIIGTDCPNLVYNSKKQAVCGIYRNRYTECQVFPSKPEDLDLVNAPCGFYFVKKSPARTPRRKP